MKKKVDVENNEARISRLKNTSGGMISFSSTCSVPVVDALSPSSSSLLYFLKSLTVNVARISMMMINIIGVIENIRK